MASPLAPLVREQHALRESKCSAKLLIKVAVTGCVLLRQGPTMTHVSDENGRGSMELILRTVWNMEVCREGRLSKQQHDRDRKC